MADGGGIPEVISRFTVDYSPAIQQTKLLAEYTQMLDNQLRNLRITAADIGKGISVGFHQPMQSGQVILDRHGKVLVDLSSKAEKVAASTKTVDVVTREHVRTVRQTAEAYNVLASQWERRVSWFLAGAGFYGLIRQLRQAINTFRQIEMDMVVIARTTDDVTFNLQLMRDELQNLGMQYGYTWETVSDIAIRWTQAGYDMQDTLEQTRVGLLALNVAEMDVQMASQGMIAIMSQWGFTAKELETVVDKLNITSDNFAVTTGDLIDALVRCSGAARAVGLTFEETIGIITATRVATGRAGREVGNAVNTILSFIMRQMTINKLMESGIEVFADAAQTKLRPAMEILADIAAKWSDNVEDMPEQLLEIAEQTGFLSEEMAELAGLQQEWTDLQKIDIETAAAGVRRRSFFIALLRNFAQVQEVVNNMHDVEGYSMRQNIMTMETLEKRYQQLQVAIEQLAVTLGDIYLMDLLKIMVDLTRKGIEAFNGMGSALQSLITIFIALNVVKSGFVALLKMSGLYTTKLSVLTAEAAKAQAAYAIAATKAAAATGAKAAASMAAAEAAKVEAAAAAAAAAAWKIKVTVMTLGISLIIAGIATYLLHLKKIRDEEKVYRETLAAVSEELDRLDGIMDRTIEDTAEYNRALEQKRSIVSSIAERYPSLIEGYDEENHLLILNEEALRKAREEQELLNKEKEKSLTIYEEMVKRQEEEIKNIESNIEKYKDTARTVEELAKKRELLLEAIEKESVTAEERERYMKQEESARKVIINLVGEEAAARIKASNWSVEAINKEIEAIKEKENKEREALRTSLENARKETEEKREESRKRIAILLAELQAIRTKMEVETKTMVDPWTGLAVLTPRSMSYWDYIKATLGISVPGAEDIEFKETLEKRRAAIQEEIKKEAKIIDESIKQLESLDKQLADLITTTGSFGGNTDNLGDTTKKLIDIIRQFIETALRASEVQGMINAETQRQIDLTRARIDYYTREGATEWERRQALQEEIRLLGLLKEKQEGVNKEADLLRAALEKLEQRKRTVNTSTEEGQQAYKALESQIESTKDAINRLEIELLDLAKAQEIGISSLERIRSLRASEIDYIEQRIKQLTREGHTVEEAAFADRLRIRLMELYSEKIIENANRIREWEQRIQEAKDALDGSEGMQRRYNETLVEATMAINSLRLETENYKLELHKLENTNYQVERSAKALEDAYKESIQTLDYFAKLGVFTTEQLLQTTLNLYNKFGNLTLEQERDRTSRLADIYKDMFRTIQREAEEAYQNRISLLEKETEEAIALIQQQLDALSEEEKLEDREEARRQHEQKMTDLMEELRYHELRTGIEHQRAIVDIERQMAEEQRRWELQQAEWERQDRRDALNKQIEDIRESARQQREEWEKAYLQMQADFDDHIVSLLAVASAYDSDFFEDARRKGELWLEGFRTGLPEQVFGDYLAGLVSRASGIISSIPGYADTVTTAPSEIAPPATVETKLKVVTIHDTDFDVVAGRAYMQARRLADALSESVWWDSSRRKVIIDGKEFEPFVGAPKYADDLARGTAWVGVREVGEALGYTVDWIGNIIRLAKTAHTGALTLNSGLAMLKRGELIFPPNLSLQLERLINVLVERPLQSSIIERNRMVNFYAPLFNVEEQNIGDEVDLEITFRELKRQITNII